MSNHKGCSFIPFLLGAIISLIFFLGALAGGAYYGLYVMTLKDYEGFFGDSGFQGSIKDKNLITIIALWQPYFADPGSLTINALRNDLGVAGIGINIPELGVDLTKLADIRLDKWGENIQLITDQILFGTAKDKFGFAKCDAPAFNYYEYLYVRCDQSKISTTKDLWHKDSNDGYFAYAMEADGVTIKTEYEDKVLMYTKTNLNEIPFPLYMRNPTDFTKYDVLATEEDGAGGYSLTQDYLDNYNGMQLYASLNPLKLVEAISKIQNAFNIEEKTADDLKFFGVDVSDGGPLGQKFNELIDKDTGEYYLLGKLNKAIQQFVDELTLGDIFGANANTGVFKLLETQLGPGQTQPADVRINELDTKMKLAFIDATLGQLANAGLIAGYPQASDLPAAIVDDTLADILQAYILAHP